MVAYSFKARFRAPILAGTKAQTIRAPRARHARPGEELQLYTGMRTKYCSLIGRSACLFVLPITIYIEKSRIEMPGEAHRTGRSLDLFAQYDGFSDWLDMRSFWHEQHPGVQVFDGVLIRWEPISSPQP
jgi:hypothetical protein